ncbi:hypothetical protein RRG08_017994 [Elysia crispata]|uniref:Uncharacterized protein n=1 Tax=Elysia crispata TaxID=231223 RepID=A0AAE0ZDW8_9GAST|nr:hypothetical protein RRG08_017994 [Elysia crispata]
MEIMTSLRNDDDRGLRCQGKKRKLKAPRSSIDKPFSQDLGTYPTLDFYLINHFILGNYCGFGSNEKSIDMKYTVHQLQGKMCGAAPEPLIQKNWAKANKELISNTTEVQSSLIKFKRWESLATDDSNCEMGMQHRMGNIMDWQRSYCFHDKRASVRFQEDLTVLLQCRFAKMTHATHARAPNKDRKRHTTLRGNFCVRYFSEAFTHATSEAVYSKLAQIWIQTLLAPGE